MKQLLFKKYINTSNTKRINCNVYLKAYCEWGKVQNVKKNLKLMILRILSIAV